MRMRKLLPNYPICVMRCCHITAKSGYGQMPAKIIGIDKGDIEPGKVADIVIFDPDETYVIDKNTFFSKGRNTPFDGRKVTGKVRMTLVDGQVVYEDKEK